MKSATKKPNRGSENGTNSSRMPTASASGAGNGLRMPDRASGREGIVPEVSAATAGANGNGYHGAAEPEIAERAYHLWEQAGRPDGGSLDFWLQAEGELRGGREISQKQAR